ncbi:MAG TPA: hypothetical protein VMS21_03940, partial [Methylomirabilota bacterium]|nr:hypothetical protein [Methylomirabilota bacterium]
IATKSNAAPKDRRFHFISLLSLIETTSPGGELSEPCASFRLGASVLFSRIVQPIAPPAFSEPVLKIEGVLFSRKRLSEALASSSVVTSVTEAGR